MKKDKLYFSKILHPDKGKIGYFGKYQYIFKKDNIEISLILLINNILPVWEIFCLKGGAFEDVERFETKNEALKQIKKYLKIK